MQIEESGKDVSNAKIGFKLLGVQIDVDFIDREGFKIVVKRLGEKQDQIIEVGRKGELGRNEKAINAALVFANLSLEEGAQVQDKVGRFIDKYFNPSIDCKNIDTAADREHSETSGSRVATNVAEECAAQ